MAFGGPALPHRWRQVFDLPRTDTRATYDFDRQICNFDGEAVVKGDNNTVSCAGRFSIPNCIHYSVCNSAAIFVQENNSEGLYKQNLVTVVGDETFRCRSNGVVSVGVTSSLFYVLDGSGELRCGDSLMTLREIGLDSRLGDIRRIWSSSKDVLALTTKGVIRIEGGSVKECVVVGNVISAGRSDNHRMWVLMFGTKNKSLVFMMDNGSIYLSGSIYSADEVTKDGRIVYGNSIMSISPIIE